VKEGRYTKRGAIVYVCTYHVRKRKGRKERDKRTKFSIHELGRALAASQTLRKQLNFYCMQVRRACPRSSSPFGSVRSQSER